MTIQITEVLLHLIKVETILICKNVPVLMLQSMPDLRISEFTWLCACSVAGLLRDTAADIYTVLRRVAMRSPVISVTLQIFAECLPQKMKKCF